MCRTVADARAASMLVVAMSCAAAAFPAHGSDLGEDLTRLSFDQLGEIRVTSVSRKEELLIEAPASIHVITAEDIRRSGATSLPEVLRLAPNLQVAQVSASGYAISARGLNGSNSSSPNKLLVLIDGRSVYSPLFSGVFWDAQHVVLEDVERIEVISGPGGTLWGVNAVNGVINVITRSSDATRGSLVVAGAGTDEAGVTFRYGGALDADGSYRVFGSYRDHTNTHTADGTAINDAGHMALAGFRMDWSRDRDHLSVHGNVYDGVEQQPAPGAVAIDGLQLELGDVPLSGANVTARWQRGYGDGSSLVVQAYYDRSERTVPPTFAETLDIVDLQVQHRLKPLGRHDLIWGANFRYSHDRIVNSPYFAFLPADTHQRWTSLFVQDEVALAEDWRLILGTRLERNDYTGTEVLPNVRLAWSPTSDRMLWSAISRAVRAPSRLDRDAYVPGVPPFLLDGGHQVRSEVANVYEIGYRARPTSTFSYSATAFHNDYDHLRTQEIDPSYTFIVFSSQMEGSATGLELWGTYQASSDWRLSGGFTALRERLWLKPGSNDLAAPLASGLNPSNWWQLRSNWNVGATGEIDATVRHVAELDRHSVPAYTVLDLRLGWSLRSDLHLSISARNLFGSHAEYRPVAVRSEIEPSAFLKLTWAP